MVLIWRWIQDALTAAITQFEVAEQDQVALALAREGIETERANLGRLREDIEPLSEKRLARALRAFDQMLAAEVRKREAAEAQHAALTAEYEEMAKDFNHLVEHELRSSNRRFGMEPPADPKKGRIIRPQKWRRGPAATTGPTTYGTMSADQSQLS
jgi:hypothetical protein